MVYHGLFFATTRNFFAAKTGGIGLVRLGFASGDRTSRKDVGRNVFELVELSRVPSDQHNLQCGWWCAQSDANPSPPVNRLFTGYFRENGPVLAKSTRISFAIVKV